MSLTSDIEREAARAGFELVGVAPVEPAGGGWFAPHAERMRAWLAAGQHADMDWIAQRAEERVVPERLLPGVKSAVVLWMSHRAPTPARPPGLRGRVAAYAWGRDYHNVAGKSLRRLKNWIIRHHPEVRLYLSIDTGAVLERAFAERAGVAWIGRSSMAIHPRLGTFGTLAVIFCDVELPAAPVPHPGRCGTCTACVEECPTGAIGPDGVVDARRCISYWTIEHRGVVPAEVRPALGDWTFGCDVCQDVCPWNHHAPRADPGRWRPDPERAWPDLVAWIGMGDAQLDAALEGSPMRRARPAGLRRNALTTLANLGAREALPAVEACLAGDPDPVVRATAAWAARALGSADAAARAAADPDPRVRAEATSPLPPGAGCATSPLND